MTNNRQWVKLICITVRGWVKWLVRDVYTGYQALTVVQGGYKVFSMSPKGGW